MAPVPWQQMAANGSFLATSWQLIGSGSAADRQHMATGAAANGIGLAAKWQQMAAADKADLATRTAKRTVSRIAG
jgi:hypothetical protein